MIRAAGERGRTLVELRRLTGLRREVLHKALEHLRPNSVVGFGETYVERAFVESLAAKGEAAVADFHRREPLASGMPLEALKSRFAKLPDDVFGAIQEALVKANKLRVDKDLVMSPTHSLRLSPDEQQLNDSLINIFLRAKLEPPKISEVLESATAGTRFCAADARKFLKRFIEAGEIVKVAEDLYFSREAIDALQKKLGEFAASSPGRSIDMAAFKDLAGVSRKFAIPLIEYFDRERVTVRRGVTRVVL